MHTEQPGTNSKRVAGWLAMAGGKAEARGKVLPFLLAAAFCVIGLVLLPSRGLALGTYTIAVGERVTVRWSASYVTNPTQAVWLVSGTQIKKVSSDLRSCTVEGVSEGTGSVTVTVYYLVTSGSYTYSMHTTDAFTIKVIAPQPTAVSLNQSSLLLREGKTATLSPTVTPSGASTTYSWASSNSGVASVSTDGTVYANHIGSATITVTTANGKSDTCLISVLDPLATVIDASPTHLAESVAVGVAPSITFSAPLSAGPNFNAIQLLRESDMTDVQGEKTIRGNQAVFTPSAALDAATRYRFIIPSDAVRNRYGTPNATETVVSFVTTPFLSIVTDPCEKQTDVAAEATLNITFDQPIKPGENFGNIKMAAGNTNVLISATIEGKMLRIAANPPLRPLTSYTLTLPANALTDAQGVRFALPFTLHFTTAVATGSFAGGNGSAETPYLIATEQHLRNMGDQLDRHYRLIADIALTQDWKMVGSSTNPFKGYFDGGHHAITNFSPSDAARGGLFGALSGATVMNVRIALSSTAKVLYANNYTYAHGILADESTKSTVSGCSVSGEQISQSTGNYWGGLIGYAANSEFRNCSSYLDMKAYMLSSVRIGGLVGYASYCTISDCFAAGSIYGNTNGAPSGASASSGTQFIVGGLVGEAKGGSIQNCISKADVTAYRSGGYILANGFFGGLLGKADLTTVKRCKYVGNMKLSISATLVVSYNRYLHVGGLIGKSQNNSVTDSSADADILCEAFYNAPVYGYVGGITGCSDHVSYLRCSSSGVMRSTVQHSSATHLVGGAFGWLDYSPCTDCYTRMDVYGRSTNGSDTGGIYLRLGHFAGALSEGTVNCYAANQCYRVDFVDRVNYKLANFPCDYFFGDHKGTLSTSSYANSKNSIESDVTLLTDAQMRQTESYVGWDFADTWGIDLNTNGGYPFLNPPIGGVTAEGCEQAFDALPHQIRVTAPAAATVAYSLDGSAFSDVNPVFTMTAAPVTVFYRVTLGEKSMAGFSTINLLPVITGLAMDTTTLDVGVGVHYRIPVTLTCADSRLAGVLWASSNTDILDFDADGWLIAKAPGTVQATCTAWDGSGFTLSRTVNVHEQVAVQMSPYIREIKARAFAGCTFDEMNLLACEQLVAIGSRAFADCKNLNALYIGESVRDIAADAFAGCNLICLYCFEGSAAHTYAVNNGISYALMQR